MNGSVTKSVVNKRNKLVVDLNSVARLSSTIVVEEGRESNRPNFKENQVTTLKIYDNIHLDKYRLF